MQIRRRIALFIDPTLQYADPGLYFDLGRTVRLDSDTLHYVRRIARALEKIEARKRRPRNVFCNHPEMHEDVAA